MQPSCAGPTVESTTLPVALNVSDAGAQELPTLVRRSSAPVHLAANYVTTVLWGKAVNCVDGQGNP
jgi:hypothetical protein